MERSTFGTGGVGLDDLIDALACLLTAFHISTGRIESLGRAGQRDGKGRLMEIVTWAVAARTTTA
jgi:hypothetical protein